MFRHLGDDKLARLAAEGSERAFAAIYERHHQGIYRYCRSILRNDEDARDALQNTIVKALRALPGETREIALKPWLYRVAHNEAISLLRRRANDAPIDDVGEIAAAQAHDAATRERLRTLMSDLEHLPERQRSALVMRELSGLSYEEIGGALARSPAAAKQAVYEAREALHQLEEGRSMECEHARRSISADDRRILRGRQLRAHLRSCEDCRTFAHALRARRADLAALAPPLPAGVAAALLNGIVGGGGGGGAGGGLLGLFGSGSAALKAGAAAVTIAVGVGTYEITERRVGPAGEDASSAALPARAAQGDDAGGAGHRGGARTGKGDGRAGVQDKGRATGDGSGHGDEPPGGAGTGESRPGGSGGSSGGSGGSSGGSGGSSGGSGGSSGEQAATGGGPPGGSPPGLDGFTPPGQGGTPPGLGGTPPGLGEGTTPGLSGVPPDQAKK